MILRKYKIAMSVIVTFMLIFSTSAYAFATSYFDGGKKVVSNNGAAATIEVQNPYVTVDVSAWVMTASSDGSGWASVGWGKRSGQSNPQQFYEYVYTPTNLWVQRDDFGAATNSSYNYKVGCDSTTMYFIIDGVTKATVSLTSIPYSRSEAQFFGETHSTAEQSPGSVSNPVTFSVAQYKTTSNSWVSCGVTNPYTAGQGSLTTQKNNIDTGDTTWEIWDSRY
ncbi:MAG: hypothetical protein RO469_00910 [Thermincola sp.]|jgi:hypothetical protein|nr:hypothetical protein [Thermincola sp.]MDT3701542.1 hypothetical protein [Thermincola sp.]